ncbi:hypothetical protein APASM_2794 [Actinosynnema pretiosum subsp. pretiosum]|nr:hypothetical protein APASM_2794 [Actinosynnema pretiosum subsp. pretiosum]
MYALSPGSAFERGGRELLRSKRAFVIEDPALLLDAKVDLVVTASEKVDFSIFPDTTTFVVPHGLGFHKFVPDAEWSKRSRLSGLVKDEHLRRCAVRQIVTCSDQVDQLREVTPHINGKTVLCGDLSFEVIRNSGLRRPSYRKAFGLKGEQKLVVVTSTWGRQSLLGQARDVIGRLLDRLPREEYRIALVLHPNVWAHKGEGALLSDLKPELAGGVLLVRPEQGWQAAIVAADLVIGDHGSVSLYAAMNGTPFLLAASGDVVVPRTSMATLVSKAPRLRLDDDFPARCRAVIAGEGQLDAQALIDQTVKRPDGTAKRLRNLFYKALGLSHANVPLWQYEAPPPLLHHQPPEANAVRTKLDGSTVTVETCASVNLGKLDRVEKGWKRHLAVPAEGSSLHYRHAASVIIDGAPCSEGGVFERLGALRGYYPRCPVVVVRDGSEHVADVLDKGHYRIQADGDADPVQQTAVLYALIAGGQQPSGGFITKFGAEECKVHISQC